MNAESIPRCAPPIEFSDLPYHWMQWQTPYRSDEPQPWGWDKTAKQWVSCAGVGYSPERAAAMQWHYLQPAHVPMTATDDEQTVVRLAALLLSQRYAERFNKPQDDPLVRSAMLDALQTTGLTQAYKLIDGLSELGLQIVRR